MTVAAERAGIGDRRVSDRRTASRITAVRTGVCVRTALDRIAAAMDRSRIDDLGNRRRRSASRRTSRACVCAACGRERSRTAVQTLAAERGNTKIQGGAADSRVIDEAAGLCVAHFTIRTRKRRRTDAGPGITDQHSRAGILGTRIGLRTIVINSDCVCRQIDGCQTAVHVSRIGPRVRADGIGA